MAHLVATAWTSAGATSPMHVPATSPVPIAQRVAAVADAGYCGLGVIADDLAIIRDTIGYVGLRDLLAEHELTHIEIELIERWWIPRGEPGHTYDVRDLLFDQRAVTGVHQDRFGERASHRRSAGTRRPTPRPGR